MEKIPKIIHQIWIGPEKQPSMWMDTFAIDYIAKYPDYTYKLWNNDNIMSLFELMPHFKLMFDVESSYAGKADLARYMALYLHGGIYVDADSVWVNEKSFDPLIDMAEDGIFAAYEPKPYNIPKKRMKQLKALKYDLDGTYLIANGIIGARRYHPVFDSMFRHIENYGWHNYVFDIKRYTRYLTTYPAWILTGPVLLTQMLTKCKALILPSDYFYPVSWKGINSIDYHKYIKLPSSAYTFQYGYSTNNLSAAVNKFYTESLKA